ncbi:hypothetical protein U1Q18_003814 [Sarracenia purpurea var. burkii]
MELWSCSHLHFIQTIRAGCVEKMLNVNSFGSPALVFKKLEDIYGSKDAEKHDSLSILHAQDRYADMRSDCESLCLTLVERKTKKLEINTDEFNHKSDDDEESADDNHLGEITLKQLKERCKTKKRKLLHSPCLFRKQECTDWQSKEDDSDLKETINSWKSKLSKNLKGQRKRVKKCAYSSSQPEVSVKSEQILSAEDYLQASSYSPAHVNVKIEVSETEYSKCRNMICIADDTSNSCSEPLGLCREVFSEILQGVKPELPSKERRSLEEGCQNCVVSEVCYDHLKHLEPNRLILSTGGGNKEADNLKKTRQQFLIFPTSEDKGEGCIEHPVLDKISPETFFSVNDQVSDTCNNIQSKSSVHEMSRQRTGISGVHVPDIAMDKSLCCMERSSAVDSSQFEDSTNEILPPSLEIDYHSSPLSNCCSSRNSNEYLSPEIALVSIDDDPLGTEIPPLMSICVDAARNCLSPHKNPVACEGGSTTKEEKQPLRSSPDDAESSYSKRNQHYDVVHMLSLPQIKKYHNFEQCSPPERLLSTRKARKILLFDVDLAISPTSQEKLCQAMNGVELNEMRDHYGKSSGVRFVECENKLQFGKETENRASPVGPEVEGTEVNTNPDGLVNVTRALIAMSPKQITKKPKNDRKIFPPKGFRKGCHLSRSLPHLSTGETSLQSCSERAVAFSQRQMHDIECLAVKLMQELKFMKDIVKGKLLSKVPPSTFLEDDMDEV